MGTKHRCFFAYPSHYASVTDVIETTIDVLQSYADIDAFSWKKFSNPANLIIDEVCRGIDYCDVFACDLSYLNTNVLFELGYAVSKSRYIWIILDPSIKGAKSNYEKLGFLSTILYTDYSNHTQLTDRLLSNLQHIHEREPLSGQLLRAAQQTAVAHPGVLYLKCEINTEPSDRLTRRNNNAGVTLTTDDPSEVASQTFAWYL